MDRKNLDKTHLLIKKHIETISVDGIPDDQKEKEYYLLKKDVESIMIFFNNHQDNDEKETIRRYIKKEKNLLFKFLTKVNRYDYQILQLYVMLEDLH